MGILRHLLLPLLLLLGASASAQPMLVAVAPDLPDSAEAVAVGSNASWDLSGWKVDDGEGWIPLPASTLQANQSLWLTNDLDKWQAMQGSSPAQAWQTQGRFQLSNDGEGLRLLNPQGNVVDAFAWGDGEEDGFQGYLNYTSDALVYQRDAGWPDTDHARDWKTPRMHRIGESRLDAPTFNVQALTLYSSPDSSHAVLSDLIASARSRLHLHVYEFDSLDLANRFADAKRLYPGLDVQVLIDGQPVGLQASERHRETQALKTIQDAGGGVTLAGHGRYAYHHLKVLVADDVVAVQSENWRDSGVPRDPSVGNRGWGVAVHDADMADWFTRWMAADRAAWDARPFDAATFDPLFEPVAVAAPRIGGYGPIVPSLHLQGSFKVTPLVSPDQTQDPRADPVAAVVDQAHETVVVQQLDLAMSAANPLGWRSDDPLLQALARASGRGVDVRVQAAAPFSSDDDGNQKAIDWLASQGVAAEVLDRPGISTLHNKGLVVDGRWTIVGSMNGNHHSRSANREVMLLIDSPEVAQWYSSLFQSDWEGARPAPDSSVVGEDLRSLPWAPLPSLLAVASVGALRRRRHDG